MAAAHTRRLAAHSRAITSTPLTDSPAATVTRRVAFDIGSGMVKMGVADAVATDPVEPGGVVKTRWTEHELSRARALRFTKLKGELLDRSNNTGGFRPPAIAALRDTLATMLAEARALPPLGTAGERASIDREGEGRVELSAAGVATAAFRDAANGRAVAAELGAELGIRLLVIDQHEEARLGLRAAAVAAGLPAEQTVAWDVGGGSFQLCAEVPPNECAPGEERGGGVADGKGSVSVSSGDRDASRAGGDPRVGTLRVIEGKIGFYPLVQAFAKHKGIEGITASALTSTPTASSVLLPVSAPDADALARWVDAALDGGALEGSERRAAEEATATWFKKRIGETGTVVGIAGVGLITPTVSPEAVVTLSELEAALVRRLGKTAEELVAAEPMLSVPFAANGMVPMPWQFVLPLVFASRVMRRFGMDRVRATTVSLLPAVLRDDRYF
eukprot:m.132091 g.132091  ORF g.132091 m.132091 type:complete len:446 (+) comp13781_c0_seq7:3135-4472(+)